jgi:hypothetical protein
MFCFLAESCLLFFFDCFGGNVEYGGKVLKCLFLLFYWCSFVTVTVKIEEEKKAKVDRFLASIMLQEGVKVTLQEAIGLMIDYALENEEEVIKKLRELPVLEEDPAWKALENPKHWGVKDSSKRIDEFVYGC